MFPQSRNTIVRSATSGGGWPISPSKCSPRYSHGSGNSSGDMYISVSLPSCFRIASIASSEPSASPSGFSCVVSSSLSAAAELGHHLFLFGGDAHSSSSSSSEMRIPRSIDSSKTN